MVLNDYEFIVFAKEHYNPLGIIRSLGENGIHPIAIILKTQRLLASKSRYISKLHFVESIEEGYQLLLQEYGTGAGRRTFVLTCDDKITSYLDLHYDELKECFYFFNAGEDGRITKYMNKDNINKLAIRHGLNVLKTWMVQRGQVPVDVEYPVITKSIASTVGGWKDDVFVCYSEQELVNAYEHIKSPVVLLQKYIKKKNELVMEGFSVARGEKSFISIATSYNYLLKDRYSSYMTVKNFKDEQLCDKIGKMLREVCFEGIFEIEFLVDENDELYFLEINFRNSTWSYASTCAGMPLPILWTKSMVHGDVMEDCYKEIQGEFKAMVEPTDFLVRVLGKQISLIKWLKELAGCRCRYYLSLRDMKPIFAMLGERIKR